MKLIKLKEVHIGEVFSFKNNPDISYINGIHWNWEHIPTMYDNHYVILYDEINLNEYISHRVLQINELNEHFSKEGKK